MANIVLEMSELAKFIPKMMMMMLIQMIISEGTDCAPVWPANVPRAAKAA